jgi:hypothetical protein
MFILLVSTGLPQSLLIYVLAFFSPALGFPVTAVIPHDTYKFKLYAFAQTYEQKRRNLLL